MQVRSHLPSALNSLMAPNFSPGKGQVLIMDYKALNSLSRPCTLLKSHHSPHCPFWFRCTGVPNFLQNSSNMANSPQDLCTCFPCLQIFPHRYPWLTPSLAVGLCSDGILSVNTSLTTLFKIAIPPRNTLPYLALFFSTTLSTFDMVHIYLVSSCSFPH